MVDGAGQWEGLGAEWVLHLLLVSKKKKKKEGKKEKKVLMVNAASWQTLAIIGKKLTCTKKKRKTNKLPKNRTNNDRASTSAAPCWP